MKVLRSRYDYDTASAGDRSNAGAARPYVVGVHEAKALDASLVGAKAANLARCVAAGLPVLPGLVVTTSATSRWAIGEPAPPEVLDELRHGLGRAGPGWVGSLVVRSSSTVEDAARSSMAGRFRSELDVRGWDAIVGAVRAVRDSAGVAADPRGNPGPIAVLLQPQLAAAHGGVLFGIDPVHGDRRHLVVEVAAGNPSDLVSGRTTAAHLLLSRRGRRIGRRGDGDPLGRRERRELARMATTVGRLFGTPQDVEWAFDDRQRLWLLQSRPVTAVAEPARGPLLGTGPVAETFPEPLRRLEVDTWLAPLREGIVRALRVTGAVSKRRLARSPVALAVEGWAAVDLEVLGVRRRRVSFGPTTGLRRLLAAWRVGRLRAALPALVADVVARVDDHLADVPRLDTLDDTELVALLANGADELVAVHGYEVLAGMLLASEPDVAPAPALALSALARTRAEDLDDAAVIAREPVVLCLVAPGYGGTARLPAAPRAPVVGTGARLGVRDSLRVRSRWLQELSGRAMALLGERLVAAGRLASAERVRELRLAELRSVVAGAPVPPDIEARARVVAGAPLPPEFRLSATGTVVVAGRVNGRAARTGADGLGAGGGRAAGRVCHRWPPAAATDPAVLVVPTLDPGLATVLPSLAGLVSESGSTLSHLAILARELAVPTIVGVADARLRFPAGSRVLVDGTSGEVRRLATYGADSADSAVGEDR